MTNSSIYLRLLFTAGVVGLMSALGTHPLSAQGVGDIVRGLNAVINPGDAQRLERNNRPAEERDTGGIIAPGSKPPIGAVIPAPVATMAIVASTQTTPAPSALMRP